MPTPCIGICAARGRLSDDVARRFYEAARAFNDSEVYLRLLDTRHREFGLRVPGLSMKPRPGGPLQLLSTVELTGLSAAELNGQRGEVVSAPGPADDPDDRRVEVRLFTTAKRIKVKARNVLWVGDEEEVTN